MRSETQRRRRDREKATRAALAATPHLPGDRWRHTRWRKGTPDAVVGTIEYGCAVWGERGGAAAPSCPTRLLTAQNGWYKVGVAAPSPPEVQRSPSLDCRGASRLTAAPVQPLVPWRGRDTGARPAALSARGSR